MSTQTYNEANGVINVLALLQGHKIRTDYSVGDADKEARFAILTHTRCAAALTENGFQDSRESLAFLESPAGKMAIVGLHEDGILLYLQQNAR